MPPSLAISFKLFQNSSSRLTLVLWPAMTIERFEIRDFTASGLGYYLDPRHRTYLGCRPQTGLASLHGAGRPPRRRGPAHFGIWRPSNLPRFRLGCCDFCHKLLFEYLIIFWTALRPMHLLDNRRSVK